MTIKTITQALVLTAVGLIHNSCGFLHYKLTVKDGAFAPDAKIISAVEPTTADAQKVVVSTQQGEKMTLMRAENANATVTRRPGFDARHWGKIKTITLADGQTLEASLPKRQRQTPEQRRLDKLLVAGGDILVTPYDAKRDSVAVSEPKP